MDEDECTGQMFDVTVGEVNVTVHMHLASLTPEVIDTLLTRITTRAATADIARHRAMHALYGSTTD